MLPTFCHCSFFLLPMLILSRFCHCSFYLLCRCSFYVLTVIAQTFCPLCHCSFYLLPFISHSACFSTLLIILRTLSLFGLLILCHRSCCLLSPLFLPSFPHCSFCLLLITAHSTYAATVHSIYVPSLLIPSALSLLTVPIISSLFTLPTLSLLILPTCSKGIPWVVLMQV